MLPLLGLMGADFTPVTAIDTPINKHPLRANAASCVNEVPCAFDDRLHTAKVSVAIGSDVKGAGIFDHQVAILRTEHEIPRVEGDRRKSKIRIRRRI